jgi:hypothetical protein
VFASTAALLSRAQATRVLAGLVLLAAVVRFGTLDAKGFWGDELSTINLAHRSLGGALAGVAQLESTPPLYYVVAWSWAKLVPTTEVGARAISALCGVALVPVAYAAARELASTRAAAVTAALVACNPLLVWYSEEARSYSLVALLSAVALLFFLRALRRRRPRDYAGWALASSLALATHYFAVLLVLPQAIALARGRGSRRSRALAVGTVAGTGALLLPLALHQRSLGHATWIGHSSLLGRVASTPLQFLVGFDLTPGARPLGAVVLAAAVVGIWLAWRSASRAQPTPALLARLVVAGVALPVGLALLGLDYLDSRNLIPLLVPVLIVLAAGFAAPARSWLGPAAAVVFCASSLAVVGLTAWEPKYHSEDWRAAAGELGPARVNRLVVATPGQAARKPLEFYLPGSEKLLRQSRLAGEVDVLALPTQGHIHPAPLPGFSSGGFRLVARDRDGRFVLWRYRSARELWISPAVVRSPAATSARPVVIWQRSSSSARPPEPVRLASRGRATGRTPP